VRARWRSRLAKPLVGVVLLNAAVFLAHTLPALLAERGRRAEESALRAELGRERTALVRLRERALIRQQNARDFERFHHELLLPRAELDSVLRELEALAPSREPRSYRAEALKGAGGQRIAVSMPVKGSYAQLRGFLGRLETLPRFLTIDRISLRDSGGPSAGLDVSVSFYLQAEAAR
jgi:Tfp pilus assembly protein PilO